MPENEVLTKTLIPQDLHGREYLKPWLDKPWTPEVAGEVFKKLDGAETLIGRKIGIPGDDAKPEEIEKFYASLRPAKPEDYEITLGAKPDEKFVTAFRAAGHKAGISKKQMADLVAGVTPHFQATEKEAIAANAKREEEFSVAAKLLIGDKDYAKKVAQVQAVLKEHAPEIAKKFPEKIDDPTLALLFASVNAIIEKFVPEDQLSGGKGGSGGGGNDNDKEALTAEAQKIYANPAWRDFQHADHAKLVAREKEIWANPVFKK